MYLVAEQSIIEANRKRVEKFREEGRSLIDAVRPNLIQSAAAIDSFWEPSPSEVATFGPKTLRAISFNQLRSRW